MYYNINLQSYLKNNFNFQSYYINCSIHFDHLIISIQVVSQNLCLPACDEIPYFICIFYPLSNFCEWRITMKIQSEHILKTNHRVWTFFYQSIILYNIWNMDLNSIWAVSVFLEDSTNIVWCPLINHLQLYSAYRLRSVFIDYEFKLCLPDSTDF